MAVHNQLRLRDEAFLCSCPAVAVWLFNITCHTRLQAGPFDTFFLYCNECGKSRESASAQNVEITWETNFNEIVATVECDKENISNAMQFYVNTFENSKFVKQDVLMVLSKLASLTNSISHDTKGAKSPY